MLRRVIFPRRIWGQRLAVRMAIASSLRGNSSGLAFAELRDRQEILLCSRVKQVKQKGHPLCQDFPLHHQLKITGEEWKLHCTLLSLCLHACVPSLSLSLAEPRCPIGPWRRAGVDRAAIWCFIKDHIYSPSITRSLILQLPEVFIVPRQWEELIPVHHDPVIHTATGRESFWTLQFLSLNGFCLLVMFCFVLSFYISLAVNENSSA